MSKKNTRAKIVPAILAKDGTQFNRQYRHLAPYFNYFQIDICDGRLVPTQTRIRPSCLRHIRPKHGLELHLMVKNVPSYVTGWIKSKLVKKIIWHYEANHRPDQILALNKFIKYHKIKTGLSINPGTGLGSIVRYIPHFDTIQLMGVNPGKMGQYFQPKVLKKIKALRQRYPMKNIAVDGGVNSKNFGAIVKAGANIIAIGSYFQKADSILQAKKMLR